MTRALEQELAELERATAELRHAIAEPLRELAITALAVLSTPRSLLLFALAAFALAGLAGLVYGLVDVWT